MRTILHIIGANVMGIAYDLGGICILQTQIIRAMFPPKLDMIELWRNLYKVGVKSFPIVAVTAMLVGAIMVIQTGALVAEFDAIGLVGWGAGFATLREVGPILIGLMFSGRVGANNTAELGTMVVTEQVDALRALAINPVTYLLVPRFIAIVTMMFLLTVIGDVVALVAGSGMAYIMLGIHPELFYSSFVEYIEMWDLMSGLIKALFFGVAIALVSCHYGMATRGGAVGVGQSVNSSVVASAVNIFVLDFLLTTILP